MRGIEALSMEPRHKRAGRTQVTGCRFAACAVLAAVMTSAGTPALGQFYHTYSQIGTMLQDAEDNYPGLCQRYDLGSSYQGRSIWALRISDNMPAEEDEPGGGRAPVRR